MELSPRIYHWFIRPSWFREFYIDNIIKSKFDFCGKTVLDFGSGTGTSSTMFDPVNYHGVDCDPKRIQYAKRLQPEYSFSVLDKDCLPVLDNSVDYILIISVLHHIATEELPGYLKDFRRVLKPYGKILIIEPCFFTNYHSNNLFMKVFDKGKYILHENEYLNIFKHHNYKVEIIEKYTQLVLYNKLFFTATPV